MRKKIELNLNVKYFLKFLYIFIWLKICNVLIEYFFELDIFWHERACQPNLAILFKRTCIEKVHYISRRVVHGQVVPRILAISDDRVLRLVARQQTQQRRVDSFSLVAGNAERSDCHSSSKISRWCLGRWMLMRRSTGKSISRNIGTIYKN